MAEPTIPPGFDFTDPDLYARRLPTEELAELRRAAPVWWNPKPRGVGGFDDDGYWVVTRHADVVAVSRASEVYSSWENTAIIRHAEGTDREQIELQRLVLPSPRAAATSSLTWRVSCPCRRSRNCSACRRKTGARSSSGRTR